MTRDHATRILARILATIDGGGVPARVDGVWVFGSYARGALEPGDIDLIVVHEQMSEALRNTLTAEAEIRHPGSFRNWYYPDVRYRSMIIKPLRKPGEEVDLLLGGTIEQVLSRYRVAKHGVLVQLWTPKHRNWQRALASIAPDPHATRAPRTEFIRCKRARCSWEDMQRLTTWIGAGALTARRVEPPEGPVRLRGEYRRWSAHWTACEAMGRKSLECLPLGMWWMQSHRARDLRTLNGAVSDGSYSYQVTFGTLHPWRIAQFLDRPEATATAHVLHFSRGEPREVLEFRRGPAWADFDHIDRDACKAQFE